MAPEETCRSFVPCAGLQVGSGEHSGLGDAALGQAQAAIDSTARDAAERVATAAGGSSPEFIFQWKRAINK